MRKAIGVFLLVVVATVLAACGDEVRKDIRVTEEISFDTVRQDDPSIPKGQTRVSQAGRRGRRRSIYTAVYRNDKLRSRKLIRRKTLRPPRDEILLVGTLTTETARAEIGFPVTYIDDPNLARGQAIARQEGVNGIVERTYHVGYRDGVEVSRTLIGDKTTRQPITRIVANGSGLAAGTGSPAATDLVHLGADRQYHQGPICHDYLRGGEPLATKGQAAAQGYTACICSHCAW